MLLHLVRPELRTALRSVVRQSLNDANLATRRLMVGRTPAAGSVILQAEPVPAPDGRAAVLVMFTEAPNPAIEGSPKTDEAAADAQLHAFELEDYRRELALAVEQAERNYDELRDSSEEATALNEELQSSNEELESSREELQSLNEELTTINAELEDKIIETARNADDLTNLLDSTHIATVLLDRELRLRRFTPLAAQLFSLRAGDEGRLLSDVASRVGDPAFSDDARTVLALQTPAEAEVRSDSGQYFLRRIQPYRVGQGQVEGVVATFVDITPQRAAARQLRQLTAILDDSNDAVFSYDMSGRILTWNRGAENAYGHRREEALAKDVFALVPEAGRDAARELIEAVRRTGAAGPMDVERRTNEGRLVKTSMAVTALRDDHGEVCALLSTERDITERLRAESEIRFRRLADDIPALLRVEDGLGQAEFVNQSCVEFTGKPRDVLLGRGWLEFVLPQDRERYLVEHATAQAESTKWEIDLRLRRSDGVYRWMRSVSVPHFDAGSEFAGYVALMLDVHDRKSAESELQSASLRKDQFLAMLAHELRNPLAPIRSAVSILSRSVHADHRAAWSVGVIDRQVDILAKLLDGLLDVARIASGKEVLKVVPLELRVVAERAVEVSQPLVDARRQTLSTVIADNSLVEGDLLRLTQVVANLLNNASKYADEGTEIRLSVTAEADDAVIRVSDQGAGLSEAMLPLVFDLFSQADLTLDRAKGGLGLGLTLVRQLVTLHHGTVQAESDGLGKGSTFIVRLPRLRGVESAPMPLQADPESTAPTAQSRRVLVVDDNADGADTLACILEMEGHEVHIARDGLSAVTMAKDTHPDVVVLDVGLPGMDGYQVARHLRGHAATAKAVIIAVTGYGQADDIATALRAGFDLHFVKPVDPTALADVIGKVPRLNA